MCDSACPCNVPLHGSDTHAPYLHSAPVPGGHTPVPSCAPCVGHQNLLHRSHYVVSVVHLISMHVWAELLRAGSASPVMR